MANNQIVTELKLENSQYISGLRQSTAELQKSMKSSITSVEGLKDAYKSLNLAMKAGYVYMAYEFTKQAVEFAGKSDTVKTAFNNMANSIGTDSSNLLSTLKTASKGMISELDLMKETTTAVELMGKDVIQYMPKMIEIAAASARTKGRAVSDVLSEIVESAGKQSLEVLNNLNISSVNAAQYQEEYAAKLGKTRDQLNDTEKAAAFFYATMKAGDELINTTGNSQLTLGERVQVLKARFDDLASNLMTIMVPAFEALVDWANNVIEPIADLVKWIDKISSKKQSFEDISNELKKLRTDIERWASYQGMTAEQFIAKFKDVKNKSGDQVRRYIELTNELKKLQQVQQQSVQTSKQHTQAFSKQRSEIKETHIALSELYDAMGKYEAAALQKVQERYDKIRASKEAQLLSKQELAQLELTFEEQKTFAIIKGEQERAQKELQIREATLRSKVGLDSQYYSALEMFVNAGAQLMTSENKALFKLGQASAISQVWMNVAQAITKGYAQLGIFGHAFAALMGVVGGVQTANILKQKPPDAMKVESTKPPAPVIAAQPIAIPLAQGVFDINRDVFALLHKGESVMPKSWAESVREGELNLGGATIVVQGDVYGYDDFMDKVQTGLLDLQRRTGKQIIATRWGD